jgi:hypothetical protein
MLIAAPIGRVLVEGRSKNSNWASGRPPEKRPAEPTGFDQLARRLGLNERTWASSKELKEWCELNKNRCYIPEVLLKAWGISVDPDGGG